MDENLDNEMSNENNENNLEQSNNNENQELAAVASSSNNQNVGRSLVSRIRRLVSQSTFHENDLDNEVNNYPQNNQDDSGSSLDDDDDDEDNESDNDRLFEEYCQEAAQSSNQSHFDVQLPVQHSYLGAMDRCSGLTCYEPNKIYEIPVCGHHSLIFPGEILPMIMLQDRFFSRSSNDDEGMVFGLIFQNDGDDEKTKIYGITCQIFERGVDNQGHITVKSRANQRFIVMKTEDGEVATNRGQTFYAKVKILPEILLPDPILMTISSNYMKQIQYASNSNKIKTFLASSTRWPKFVYDHYSIVTVTEKIERYLAMLNIEAPKDPVLKSFWLARNVPLNQADRLKIFKNNCVNKRLLLIGESLNFMCYFLCKRCRNKIAKYFDIFAMSKDTVNANYCNPAGYIHETLTVNKTFDSAVRMVDRPSTEFSWFPGYAWQIAICSKCHTHVGWKFIAMNNKNLRPRTFFGLSCKSLIVSPEGREDVEVEEQQINEATQNVSE